MAEWPPRDSVFTPFTRRYTDEVARERKELTELYEFVASLHRTDPPDPLLFTAVVFTAVGDMAPEYLRPQMRSTIEAIVRKERFMFELPELILDAPPADMVAFRSLLWKKQKYFQNRLRVEELLDQCLCRIFSAYGQMTPPLRDPSPFTVPLICAIPDAKVNLQRTHNTLMETPYEEAGLFTELRDQLFRNICFVSNIVPGEPTKKPYKLASESDLPLEEAADAYLDGTPFLDFFKFRVPLKISHEERFSHMHIVGGTGAGKTTLLQNLILHDLQSDDPPALVVVDGQTDLVRKLSNLRLFEEKFRDRLILVTPRDIQHPPAINIFDVNRSRLGSYDEETREQVTAGVIQTFDYLFTGLLGADLTAKQAVFFRFVARLMLALPHAMGRNATILDMLDLMTDVGPYRSAIASLPAIPRQFFERDFPSKTFAQTKEQIRYRLNAILENPTLARLFTSPTTKVDFFSELNKGSVILVDTAKDFLKGASGNFGRIFISLVLQAILERAALPEQERRPAFLIVDEAASYFDSNIDDLLTEARKYKLGCVFAHQFLDQCTSSLRASLAANTAIKMAGGVSVGDARALAPDMRTTADFVTQQPRLHFAAYVRNVTPQAVSIPVTPGLLESQPTLSDAAYEQLRAVNRTRVSLPSNDLSPVHRAAEAAPGGATAPPPRTDGKHLGEDDTAPSPDW